MKINDRLFRRPTFVGHNTGHESMTIPGQDYTPLEIMNAFKRGTPASQVYSEHNLNAFTKMSQIEKLDFVRDLHQEQLLLRQSLYSQRMQRIQSQQQQQQLQQQQQISEE